MTQLSLEIESLIQGRRATVCVTSGCLVDLPVSPAVMLSGAFNPLHIGHTEMAEIAQREAGAPMAFELSVLNVDKPPLTWPDVDTRLRQFGHETLWLTRASTFVEKSKLFPGVRFIVGADTILRIADPKYYANERAMHQAIDAIVGAGCSFFVFGRNQLGTFQALEELPLPDKLLSICQGFAEAQFRRDISSSALRDRRSRLRPAGG